MSGDWQSSVPYTGGTLDNVREAMGIPQFGGANGEQWDLVWNGLIIQGGKVAVTAGTTTHLFKIPFSQQVLGIFTQCPDKHAAGAYPLNLASFAIEHDGANHPLYWFAIGV